MPWTASIDILTLNATAQMSFQESFLSFSVPFGQKGFGGELHVVFADSSELIGLTSSLQSAGLTVVQLGAGDGLAELNRLLEPARGASATSFDAIHLYGHGSPGELRLGGDRITGQNLTSHAAGLQTLGRALGPEGDLLIYGCDLASGPAGRELMHGLAQATGADLRASDDLTGSDELGGDWVLEQSIGFVDAQSLSGEKLDWSGTLSVLQEPVRLKSVDGVLDVTLRAHRGSQLIEVADPNRPLNPGKEKKVKGFMTYAWEVHQGESTNGRLKGDNEQGPTLQVNPGDTLRIRLENDLTDQDTNLHTHGLVIDPSGNADNVLLSIPPGYTNVYEYKISEDQEPGVNWYHPHRHGYTAEQVYRGLAGLLVIGHGDNDIEQIKDLPFRMMMIQAQSIGRDESGDLTLLPLKDVDSGQFQLTLNGQYMPDIKFEDDYEAWVQLQINPRDLIRTFFPRTSKFEQWKFADLSNYKTYYAAQDGEAFPSTVGKTRVNLEPGGNDEQALDLLRNLNGGFATALAPGKRVTELITAPPAKGKHYFSATTIQPGLPDPATGLPRQYMQPLARLKGYGKGRDDQRWDNQTLTSKSMQYEDLSDAPVDVIREIEFETRQVDGQVQFLINGEMYPNGPVIQPRAGQVEEWRVKNLDAVPHPIHLHMQSFQAEAVSIGRDGYTIPPHYYDSDVWYMDPKAINVFRIRWKPTLGESVYHCHNLFHEDGGMMAALNVIPAQPYLAESQASNDGSVSFYPLLGGSSNEISKLPAQIVHPFDEFPGGSTITPYRGSINVSMGDVNSDGIPDALVTQETGGRLKVLNGQKKFYIDNLYDFYPFGKDPGFALNVASADVNGDTYSDMIVAGGVGASGLVKVFSGYSGSLLAEFDAIGDPAYRGGVSLATGNVDGSGRERIVTAPASDGPPELKVWGWDLFTVNPTKSKAKTAVHQHGPQATTLGAPTLFAAVLAGSADDRRGLTLGSTYYAGAMGGYRRILTASASDAEAATLWRLNVNHGGHLGHGGVAGFDPEAELVQLAEFRPTTLDRPATAGFNLASVSTTTGSVVALSQRSGDGPVWTFVPQSAQTYEPLQTVFKSATKGPVRMAGS
jgi:FtsP/CotA-like multicopper oxidase with cupredoxin domain